MHDAMASCCACGRATTWHGRGRCWPAGLPESTTTLSIDRSIDRNVPHQINQSINLARRSARTIFFLFTSPLLAFPLWVLVAIVVRAFGVPSCSLAPRTLFVSPTTCCSSCRYAFFLRAAEGSIDRSVDPSHDRLRARLLDCQPRVGGALPGGRRPSSNPIMGPCAWPAG